MAVIYPAPVQGEGAAGEIAEMLRIAGERRECDALLVVRGGGSIEDLWAFNEEIVARAIRACPIPVVTGIGHETDFTIADFAADRRAPTPTAAAELLSPDRASLLASVSALAVRLGVRVRRDLEARMQHVDHLARRLIHPGTTLRGQSEILGQLQRRHGQAISRILSESRWRIAELRQRVRLHLPNLREHSALSQRLIARLRAATSLGLERPAAACARLLSSLAHLDPAAVLERGYSIVQRKDGDVVRDSSVLAVGETVALRFARGRARARIDGKD